jgi:hypothetical protein
MGEEAREGSEKQRREHGKEELLASDPFCFNFPPSHTAARVQTDAVISILIYFRGPCPNFSGKQKSRVYLWLSL